MDPSTWRHPGSDCCASQWRFERQCCTTSGVGRPSGCQSLESNGGRTCIWLPYRDWSMAFVTSIWPAECNIWSIFVHVVSRALQLYLAFLGQARRHLDEMERDMNYKSGTLGDMDLTALGVDLQRVASNLTLSLVTLLFNQSAADTLDTAKVFMDAAVVNQVMAAHIKPDIVTVSRKMPGVIVKVWAEYIGPGSKSPFERKLGGPKKVLRTGPKRSGQSFLSSSFSTLFFVWNSAHRLSLLCLNCVGAFGTHCLIVCRIFRQSVALLSLFHTIPIYVYFSIWFNLCHHLRWGFWEESGLSLLEISSSFYSRPVSRGPWGKLGGSSFGCWVGFQCEALAGATHQLLEGRINGWPLGDWEGLNVRTDFQLDSKQNLLNNTMASLIYVNILVAVFSFLFLGPRLGLLLAPCIALMTVVTFGLYGFCGYCTKLIQSWR